MTPFSPGPLTAKALWKLSDDLSATAIGTATTAWIDRFDEGLDDKTFGTAIVEWVSYALDDLSFSVEPAETLLGSYVHLEKLNNLHAEMALQVLREHQQHVFRDLFLSLALRKLLGTTSPPPTVLALAALLHDIAYPVEKFRTNVAGYAKAISEHYLETSIVPEISIHDADRFLRILDQFGSSDQWSGLYSEVVYPSLAEQGLLDARHNLVGATIVLARFAVERLSLTPQLAGKVAGVAAAIALHDRSLFPSKQLPLSSTAALLRAADELQEWGRGGGAIEFEMPSLQSELSAEFPCLDMQFTVHKGLAQPSILKLLPDKVLGLWPIGMQNFHVRLSFRVKGVDEELSVNLVRNAICNARMEQAQLVRQSQLFDREGMVQGSLRAYGGAPDEARTALISLLDGEVSVEISADACAPGRRDLELGLVIGDRTQASAVQIRISRIA
jgi:hypothetical protein